MKLRDRISLFVTVACLSGPSFAETPSPELIRATVQDHRDAAIALYREFLSLPNDAGYPEDIQALVVWLEGAFSDRSFETRRLETAANPALFAQRLRDGATRRARSQP